jgi:hypothetical protein
MFNPLRLASRSASNLGKDLPDVPGCDDPQVVNKVEVLRMQEILSNERNLRGFGWPPSEGYVGVVQRKSPLAKNVHDRCRSIEEKSR